MKKLNVSLILLHDNEKRFLLQHRTVDAEQAPDHWAFFGGGINPGETPEEAVIRESLEELSYKPQSPKMILKKDFSLDQVSGVMHVFTESYRGDKTKLRLGEGQGWGWFHSTELGDLKMLLHDRKVVEYATQFLINNDVKNDSTI